ncbi:MAG TPA: nuclear transport factor 2 family protein [Streptosporangiaceae bacterium]|nr:nuclear transport factor 2 family protein [Streptosporangiaceae bacterium]
MSQLTPTEMDAVLDEHYKFEAMDDVNGVVSTLTEDVVHDVVGFPGGPVRGRAAARAFYEHLFADISGERTEPRIRLYGPGFLVDEVMWHGRAIGHPFGFDGQDRPFSHRLLHVIEFRDGLIARENVWVDFAAIVRQLGPH